MSQQSIGCSSADPLESKKYNLLLESETNALYP